MDEESKELSRDEQYLLEFQLLENSEVELNESIVESSDESDNDWLEEKALNETQSFVLLRSESMSTEEYKEFVSARAVKLFHKGKESMCRWLEIGKELLTNKNLIDIAILSVKSSTRRIIERAIKNRSPTKVLHIIDKPLMKEEIEQYVKEELELLHNKLSSVLLFRIRID